MKRLHSREGDIHDFLRWMRGPQRTQSAEAYCRPVTTANGGQTARSSWITIITNRLPGAKLRIMENTYAPPVIYILSRPRNAI